MPVYFPVLARGPGAAPLGRTTAIRYAIVGGVAFAIDLGCLLLLAPVLPLILANSLAFLVANAANFAAGHLWVFGRNANDRDIVRRYRAVLLISLVGLALSDAFVWLGVVALGAGVVVSKVAATLAVWGWNYWARACWVYGGD